MKKTASRVFVVVLCICMLSVSAYGAEYLIPVGQVIGMELRDASVSVAAFDETMGRGAKEAGLCEGDIILSVDGKNITCPEDIRQALQSSRGFVTMTVSRKGKQLQLRLTPNITADGPKLGIYLKQGITGIGTVTFYDPETGRFGALGHGVSGGDGKLLAMVSGEVYRASVAAVKKGKAGEPGKLQGTITDGSVLGRLERNTAQGVFGKAEKPWEGEALSVAEAEEIHTGDAEILSTVSGRGVCRYSVEILKIYPKGKQDGRNLMLRVTDPELLAATGGIVQGMSGSPIIQNGKLIGAVTHVLVNDPTCGYGIFVETMLDAAA